MNNTLNSEMLVAAERVRQDRKWGSQRNHEDELWLTILAEEIGEAAKAALHQDDMSLIQEVVQVAAVAHQWIDSILARASRQETMG